MPKQLKKIAVARSWGDKDSEDYSKIWYNVCGESKWTKPTYWAGTPEAEASLKQGYSLGVVASNYVIIQQKILSYLKNKNIEKLKTQLSADFIYPGVISSDFPNNDHGKKDWDEFTYESYYTRPAIEALFFDKTDLFTEIIEKLVELNDIELYQAVYDTSIGTDINARIFLWNQGIKNRIFGNLHSLERYGESLTTQKNDADAIKKGDLITKLTLDLRTMLENKKEDPPFDFLKHQFLNLHFKLTMLKLLHHFDAEFAVHRGYKRFVSNFFIAFFSIGIAQGIHRYQTGKCLFFNKTNTQEKVENVHEAIGVFKL